MKREKKIALLLVIIIGVPILYGLIALLWHIFPDVDREKLILWSGQIGIFVPIIILAALYRFWISKKK